jgi:diacylglycerol kinase (ATP)
MRRCDTNENCFKLSAIERVVDDVSTDTRDRARQAKDTGSAAVAVAAIGVGVAGLVALSDIIW